MPQSSFPLNTASFIESARRESIGSKYNLGVRIYTSVDGRPPLTEGEEREISRHADQIHDLLLNGAMKADKDIQIDKEETLKKLLECFPWFGIVPSSKEIPNGYSNDSPIPWLKVATHQGYIILGWRKRVISIDWSESLIEENAEELFPDEDVTKYDKIIHAWGYEKAKEYLAKLLEN